jgi:hypothetical protein
MTTTGITVRLHVRFSRIVRHQSKLDHLKTGVSGPVMWTFSQSRATDKQPIMKDATNTFDF